MFILNKLFKKTPDLMFFLTILFFLGNFGFAQGIDNNKKQIGLEIVDGTVYKIPLDKYDIKVFVGNPVTTLKEGVQSLGGEGGINGSFFCPAEKSYSRCGADNSTSSDRIVDGEIYSRYPNDTGIRGIFGFDKTGKPLFVQKNQGFVEGYRKNTNEDKMGDLYNGIGNRPILLDEGYNPLMFYGDTIKYKKNTKKMKRNFICSTKDKKTIYMGYVSDKTIFEMPDYLENKYGCFFALSLDAGYSSAMIHQDKYLIGPGRNIVDGFVAVPKDERLTNQLKNYTLNKDESIQVVILYKILKNRIKNNLITKEKVLKILKLFDNQKKIRGNIPLRVKFRTLKAMIEKF